MNCNRTATNPASHRSFVSFGVATIAFVVAAATGGPATANHSKEPAGQQTVSTQTDAFEVPCFATPTHWNSSIDGPIPVCVRERHS